MGQRGAREDKGRSIKGETVSEQEATETTTTRNLGKWIAAGLFILLLVTFLYPKGPGGPVKKNKQDTEASRYAGTIKAGLDSDMEIVFSQIDRNYTKAYRDGDKRYFEYAFDDGSKLVLIAYPKGFQTGLKLYAVDIEY